METSRITWVDASKGIGIFLVVIGHTMIDNSYRAEIFSFHMPLFFFLSGYLFSVKKYKNFRGVFLAKCKSLLVPYICFSVISIILSRILIHQHIDIATFIKTFILSKRNSIYYDDPLWFLTSLFTIEMMYYLLKKYLKNNYLLFAIVLILAYFSVTRLYVLQGKNILPWSFDQSLYFILYFCLGNLVRERGLLKNNLKKSKILIGFSFIYIFFYFSSPLYSKLLNSLHVYLHVSMNIVTFLNVVLWALIAISFVIYLSQFVSYINYINFLGKNSLIIFALHVSLGFNLINRVVGRFLGIISNPDLLGLTFTIGAIVILTPVILVINRYFSFILGKISLSTNS